MNAMESQITGVSVVYSTVSSDTSWKKISKLRVTAPFEGNSVVTGEFHAQTASNVEMFLFDDVIMHTLLSATGL